MQRRCIAEDKTKMRAWHKQAAQDQADREAQMEAEAAERQGEYVNSTAMIDDLFRFID